MVQHTGYLIGFSTGYTICLYDGNNANSSCSRVREKKYIALAAQQGVKPMFNKAGPIIGFGLFLIQLTKCENLDILT